MFVVIGITKSLCRGSGANNITSDSPTEQQSQRINFWSCERTENKKFPPPVAYGVFP